MSRNKTKSTGEWIKVEDENVRHIWVCRGHFVPDCEKKGVEVPISPNFNSEAGNPFCFYCECEMDYVRTEVKI